MHRRRFMVITAAGLLVGCNRVQPAQARDAAPPQRGGPGSPVVPKSAAPLDGQLCGPTSPDLRGPYWTPDAPNALHLSPKGDLRIEGLVKGPDCRPIPGAMVHVWQADPRGRYADDRLRGRLATDKDGAYRFETVRPGNYREPNGWRPAHIHFEVTAPGFKPLVSQLYFAGDPYLSPNDSCSVCRSDGADRIIKLAEVIAPYRRQEGTFEIHLAKA